MNLLHIYGELVSEKAMTIKIIKFNLLSNNNGRFLHTRFVECLLLRLAVCLQYLKVGERKKVLVQGPIVIKHLLKH